MANDNDNDNDNRRHGGNTRSTAGNKTKKRNTTETTKRTTKTKTRTRRRPTTGLSRTGTSEEFYTGPEGVRVVMEALQRVYRDPASRRGLVAVEPSAGGGALLPGLRGLAREVRAYDLRPRARGITRADFLRLDTRDLVGRSNVLVAGNPPFGRVSSLARRFITKACGFADTVAFVLPRSFRKHWGTRSFPPHFHLVHFVPMPRGAFRVDGDRPHDVPCDFHVWRRMPTPRPMPVTVQPDPSRYAFVRRDEPHDAVFTRVGWGAGTLVFGEDAGATLSPNTHYFLRFVCGADRARRRLRNGDALVFGHDNTVGPRSVSRQQLIRYLDRLL
jgi:hypothetical protein